MTLPYVSPLKSRFHQIIKPLNLYHWDPFDLHAVDLIHPPPGPQVDGTWLAAHGGVVVVTLNYRLDVFGFLSSGDDVMPGNYGMLDQVMALQFVRDNAAAFGGDPERVRKFENKPIQHNIIF